jgi:glycosyltransferase involved in cell wall biosynthesis
MPAYNEEPGLESAVLECLETCRKAGLVFEFIIVNDCSKDRTGEIANRLAENHPEVRVCHHEVNKGAGAGIRTGLQAAGMEYLIFIPVDNPLSPEDLAPYLPHLGQADIIAGIREQRVGYPLLARVGSFIYSRILIPLLFRLRVKDPNWIQVYRRSIFSEQGIRIDYDGMFFPVAILIQAQRKGLVIVSVPARMKLRLHGKATCFRFTAVWKAFKDMMDFYRASPR